MVGALSSLFLICVYLIYEIKSYPIDAILNALIIISGSFTINRAISILIDNSNVLGRICIGTSCIVFLSPIQLILRVIKEKNYFLIPIYTAWISLIASSCWTTYGIYLSDFNVMFPNCIGIILAIVQILVYLNYKRRYPTIGEKDFTSTIGIENTYNDEGKKEDITIKGDEDAQTNSKNKPVKIVEKIEN
jgi:solute carrier family 50 protein (sugar transporter)